MTESKDEPAKQPALDWEEYQEGVFKAYDGDRAAVITRDFHDERVHIVRIKDANETQTLVTLDRIYYDLDSAKLAAEEAITKLW